MLQAVENGDDSPSECSGAISAAHPTGIAINGGRRNEIMQR